MNRPSTVICATDNIRVRERCVYGRLILFRARMMAKLDITSLVIIIDLLATAIVRPAFAFPMRDYSHLQLADVKED